MKQSEWRLVYKIYFVQEIQTEIARPHCFYIVSKTKSTFVLLFDYYNVYGV